MKKHGRSGKPARKPFLASLIFCDSVEQTEAGKINLLGAFQSMGLPTDYKKLPLTFTMWLHFEGLESLTIYQLKIRQRASNRDEPRTDGGDIETSFDGSLDMSTEVQLSDPLPTFIDFDFLFNDKPAGIRRLYVLRDERQGDNLMKRVEVEPS